MIEFTQLDYWALAWFLTAWISYTLIADHTPLKKYSSSAAIRGYRRRWMLMMIQRDNRIVDATIQGNTLNGVAFFASTTVLAIGGLMALLGSTEKAIDVLADLPLVQHTTRAEWEVKVLLMVVLFVHAFFKFAWSYRLFNYCSILIGSAPYKERADKEARAYAERAVQINMLAASHFNRGMRTFFFTMAILAWFLHPGLFLVATSWVVALLTWREFRTKPLMEMLTEISALEGSENKSSPS